MAIKAIMIDFYGTLVRDDDGLVKALCRRICDTSPQGIFPADVAAYWWGSINELTRRCSGEDFRTMEDLQKLTLLEMAGRFESRFSVEDAMADILEAWNKPEIFSDARPFLAQFPMELYLVTNGDNEILKNALQHVRLEMRNIISSEDARSYKPQLHIFEKALSATGLRPREVLFVGDSLHYDIQPAQRMGMSTAWLNRSGRVLSGNVVPDVTVKSLMQLKAMIST
jgi:2-haloacid dehalogenase/putative hydrolase of the HAD superfamily